ncbi:MAG: tetratricopeptide repeat protein [Planctomycetota bacterium]|jgi:tetratricopeptide (TPR) repeat protein
MKVIECRVLLGLTYLLAASFVLCASKAGRCASVSGGITAGVEANRFADFERALNASEDAKAVLIGDEIFGRLSEKYTGDVGFRALKSKLAAAQFLGMQMISQLGKAKDSRMRLLAGQLFGENKGNTEEPVAIPPAKSFYETSVKLFANPVSIDRLTEQEKAFVIRYYDLKLRILTGKIAEAGQALVVAEPGFKGTHDYVLVLPLVHASEKEPVNIDVLPRWMRKPEQLAIFADSCLLHFGFPFQAMMMGKEAAQLRNEQFSELDFYKSASKKCGVPRSHVAVDCLTKAMDYVGNNADATVALHFSIVQVWLDSDNCALAAGQAQNIFESYGQHADAGKAIWLYYYALSRAGSIEQILTRIDAALEDKRCGTYKGKLMYIKWWALRRTRDETARIAAVEHELLQQYGDDPMVAPIMLSRATDLLARQDYNGAYKILSELVEKFPFTRAAEQARRMLEKLKSMKRL